jgi:hypothetical protein
MKPPSDELFIHVHDRSNLQKAKGKVEIRCVFEECVVATDAVKSIVAKEDTGRLSDDVAVSQAKLD